ncbi:hypothetical protein GCM10017161_24190 [Thalassotalea marina]|uniref:5-methyltetrahydrofolate--homocysteine methyltransferase n=2 Tax=Thalassotalea marina TaxID=1673741 RepID=A0A919BLC8_9GAMM|nr:hypothetical protein GCM10017161_24190 [Thalassotalea marina]
MKTKLNLILCAMLSTTLIACGDSKTNITEKEPVVIPNPGGDDHSHDEVSSEGRLAFTTYGANEINIIDLEHKENIATISTQGYAKYIYATENKRYAVLAQVDDSQVQFLDGGIWQEDHGNHLHPYQEDPKLMDFHIDGVKPAHVTTSDDAVALFFDGNDETGDNAQVVMFNETHVAENSSEAPVLNYDTYMHGAAQARGEFLISTLRDANSATSLPDKIALYEAHGDHFHQEQVFDVSCPGLHGSAQNHDYVAFACTDGVVVIKQEGETFTASKIANTEDFAADQRIGTLKGHHDTEQFIGIAGNEMFIVDPEHGEIEKVQWYNASETYLSGGEFSFDGKYGITLEATGTLTIFEAYVDGGHAHWEVIHSIETSEHDISEMPAKHSYRLAVSHYENVVYVSDPISKQVVKYDLATGQAVDEIELSFVPDRMVWLGIVGGAADH